MVKRKDKEKENVQTAAAPASNPRTAALLAELGRATLPKLLDEYRRDVAEGLHADNPQPGSNLDRAAKSFQAKIAQYAPLYGVVAEAPELFGKLDEAAASFPIIEECRRRTDFAQARASYQGMRAQANNADVLLLDAFGLNGRYNKMFAHQLPQEIGTTLKIRKQILSGSEVQGE